MEHPERRGPRADDLPDEPVAPGEPDGPPIPADAEHGMPGAPPDVPPGPPSPDAVDAVARGGVAAPGQVALVLLSGPEDGRVVPVGESPCLLGRQEPGLVLDLAYDRWVSRRHARLTYRDGRWWIEDLDSANGTWLGARNQRLRGEAAIGLEEVIRVGHTDLMLSADSALLARAAQGP